MFLELLEQNRTSPYKKELVAEDPRVFSLNGNLAISYNVHYGKFKTFHYAYIHYHAKPSHLSHTGKELWSSITPEDYVCYVEEVKQFNIIPSGALIGEEVRHQKNWSPFEFCPLCVFEQVLLIYY